MPRRFDPKVVGAFVLAGVALGVVAAAYLGVGRFLQHQVRFVAVFAEDIHGLDVDAPVKFRGVPVGRVTSIHLSMGSTTEPLRELRMPVVFEISQTRVQEIGGEIDLSDPRAVRTLVDHGLRARLALESFLSNRRYVDLDIMPEAPPPRPSGLPLPYPEIPVYAAPGWAALQADASKLLTKLQALDLDGLVADLRRATRSLDRVGSGVEEVVAELPATLRAANGAIAAARDAARAVQDGVTPLTSETRAAVARLGATLEKAEATLQHVNELVDPAAPLAWQLTRTLDELQGGSRALRHLAESLDRDPSVLLRGRAGAQR